MFKKRGQVSVFVMVAIVVFVAFAFVFAVGYAISKGNLESQVKKTAAVSDLIDSLKNHISSCMKSSADKALLRIGEQGGFIYEEEGGSSNINSVVFEEIDNTRRAYWLLKNSWDQPPGYPTSENNLGFMQVPLLQKEDVPKGAGVIQ
ncbi:MAG: hypothetical protein NTV63_01075, partial [Candidatus Woesearchaeota archaeon]|nr:hypothetical protein [Candidatus Woesearchaeota archaeon]